MRFNKIIFFFLFTSFTFAQRTLSLKEAVEIALNNNDGIRIISKDADISKLNNTWSSAGAYPTVLLNLNPSVINNSIQQKFVNNTEINKKGALSKNINANIQLNYSILNGFKVFVTKEKLNKTEQLGKSELELKILDTYRNVSLLYFQIISLQNAMRTLIAQEIISADRKKLEAERFSLSQSGKLGFLEASLNLKDIQILIEKQKHSIKESFINLNQLMQVEDSIVYQLTDSFNLNQLKIWSQEKHQLQGSLQEKQFQIRSQIQKLAIEEIKRDRYPNLNLVADYHFNRSDNQAGFNLYSQSYGPGIGLQMSVPIYSGNRITNSIAVQSLESDKIGLEENQWRSSAENRLSLEESRANYFWEVYELENEKMVLADEHLNIIRKKSELGEANYLEFTQSIFKTIEINVSKQDALYNIILAHINAEYICSKTGNIF